MGSKRKRSGLARIIAVAVLAGVALVGLHYYKQYFDSAVTAEMAEDPLYVPTGSTVGDVLELLNERGIVQDVEAARRLAERKNFTGGNVAPGKYTLREGMSLNAVINILRGGYGAEEVKVTFHSARTLEELSGKVARNIEADSAEIADYLTDPSVAAKYGFAPETFMSMFLPDTYFTSWNTDASEFTARMAGEYKKFWNEDRLQKARNLGLSQSEVSTLASLVQAEQQLHSEERPAIAGLYINRLRRGMKLQSDPTVVFAVGDFTINRVLNAHLMHDSPYNTYKYAGLPPGPINVPQKTSVDAVLNPDTNNYLYMCAKADFSGYHAFAATLAEHNRNAAAYRKALNERKIYR